MGRAHASCEGGCNCTSIVLDGHTFRAPHPPGNQRVEVSSLERCVMSIQLLGDSKSGGHDFKLIGLTIGEKVITAGWVANRRQQPVPPVEQACRRTDGVTGRLKVNSFLQR